MRDRINDVAAGRFSLDRATRDYVRAELGFRMVQLADGREALEVERLVQRGELAAGRPLLNPLAWGYWHSCGKAVANKLGLFMQAGEAGPDILRLGLDGDEAVEHTVMASLGSIVLSSTGKL